MLIGQFSESYPPVLDGVGEVVFDYVHELRRLGDDCYAIVSGWGGDRLITIRRKAMRKY